MEINNVAAIIYSALGHDSPHFHDFSSDMAPLAQQALGAAYSISSMVSPTPNQIASVVYACLGFLVEDGHEFSSDKRYLASIAYRAALAIMELD